MLWDPLSSNTIQTPGQFKWQGYFVVDLLLINQAQQYTQNFSHQILFVFLVGHVSNNFPESTYQLRNILWVILVHYAYNHVISKQM